MTELEKIMKDYKLSNEEHERIGNKIKEIYLYEKYPVENPQIIINIGPSASGKTGLNAYGRQHFIDNNVVLINGDELRPFHPNVDEIARLYPEYFTIVTNQECKNWTKGLFEHALKNKYNIIFEGTGRTTTILKTIESQMKDYNVTVRGMAVDELNCLISLLERYEHQKQNKGWGRLVTLDDFYIPYKSMPNVISEIEKSKYVDNVEVYRRGEIPNKPTKIYSSIDGKNQKYRNSKDAVFGGRSEDRKEIQRNRNDLFKESIEFFEEVSKTREEKEILNRILELKKISIEHEI